MWVGQAFYHAVSAAALSLAQNTIAYSSTDMKLEISQRVLISNELQAMKSGSHEPLFIAWVGVQH